MKLLLKGEAAAHGDAPRRMTMPRQMATQRQTDTLLKATTQQQTRSKVAEGDATAAEVPVVRAEAWPKLPCGRTCCRGRACGRGSRGGSAEPLKETVPKNPAEEAPATEEHDAEPATDEAIEEEGIKRALPLAETLSPREKVFHIWMDERGTKESATNVFSKLQLAFRPVLDKMQLEVRAVLERTTRHPTACMSGRSKP